MSDVKEEEEVKDVDMDSEDDSDMEDEDDKKEQELKDKVKALDETLFDEPFNYQAHVDKIATLKVRVIN